MTTERRDEWIAELRARPGQDNDAVVIITGKERSGKSTFARWLARKLDPKFSHENVVFSGADFMELAVKSAPGTVIILDESKDGGFSRDAMAAKNKDLAKFLMVCGQRNLICLI